jgi:hypothetical protein
MHGKVRKYTISDIKPEERRIFETQVKWKMILQMM